MGTKNDPGKYDCYVKAGPDQPLFTLLAGDPWAPTLVRLWALLKQRDSEGTSRKASGPKIAEALACADAMAAYSIPDADEPDSALSYDLYFSATLFLDEHPPGFEGACLCNVCRVPGGAVGGDGARGF